jgi:hypothetical protein
MILFIPPKTLWRVERLHGFGKKFYGTLGVLLLRHACTTIEWVHLFPIKIGYVVAHENTTKHLAAPMILST